MSVDTPTPPLARYDYVPGSGVGRAGSWTLVLRSPLVPSGLSEGPEVSFRRGPTLDASGDPRYVLSSPKIPRFWWRLEFPSTGTVRTIYDRPGLGSDCFDVFGSPRTRSDRAP